MDCLLSTLKVGRKSKPQTVNADALAIALKFEARRDE
jgi:hypothetical protein